ncbi:cardiolipin synthetase [Hydrogenimonas sp.]|nr:cardiolipin synthetase [Hydrogenimonas sp.]
MDMQLIFNYTLLVGGEILAIVALLHMIATRRSPSSMIAWMLAIFIFPYIAVPFYFLFGHRKLIKRYQKFRFSLKPIESGTAAGRHPVERLLETDGIPPATDDNSFTLIDSPSKVYEALEESIQKAEKSIEICVYQFTIDKTTKPLVELLCEKASAGVRVRLLLDSIGSLGLYLFPAPLDRLKKSGAEIAFFMPFLKLPLRNFINLRNHRKIFIFDGIETYTGGMNLSEKYFAKDESLPLYRDFLCRIEGKATHFYAQIFAMDWAFATNSVPTLPKPPSGEFGSASVQVIPSGPDTPSEALVEALLSLIYSASSQIRIVTPYFVLNEDFMQALIIALHRGVDVTVIVPEHSDHAISDIGRGSYLRELHSDGGKILLYRGKILHAKAILFDRSCASIGSVNFDNRSLFYNFEATGFIYSEEEILSIEEWMEKIMKNCIPYSPPRSVVKRHTENFMRILSPLV